MFIPFMPPTLAQRAAMVEALLAPPAPMLPMITPDSPIGRPAQPAVPFGAPFGAFAPIGPGTPPVSENAHRPGPSAFAGPLFGVPIPTPPLPPVIPSRQAMVEALLPGAVVSSFEGTPTAPGARVAPASPPNSMQRAMVEALSPDVAKFFGFSPNGGPDGPGATHRTPTNPRFLPNLILASVGRDEPPPPQSVDVFSDLLKQGEPERLWREPSNPTQREIGEFILSIAPGVGEVMSAMEAYDAYKTAYAALQDGDTQRALVAAAKGTTALFSVIPVFGRTVKLSKLGVILALRLFDHADYKGPQIKEGEAGGESASRNFPKKEKEATKVRDITSTCVFCRQAGVGVQVDHAHPKARGGNATEANAQLACAHCNPSKRDRDVPVNPPPGWQGDWPPYWIAKWPELRGIGLRVPR